MGSDTPLVIVNSSNGFLSGFVEASAELPSDGLNGECVVHYGDHHSKCVMIVELVNGKRNGEAVILNDGIPYIELEYRNGEMTGGVVKMDKYVTVQLRGYLKNGVESGLFVEYDKDENVVWRGYYRNGKRYSEVVKSERVKGYYDEKSVANGVLLSIAEYDSDLKDKNGRCMEYENGEWVGDWMYENGVRRKPLREYRNGVIVLYDENGKKRFEGKLSKKDAKDGFYEQEPMEGMVGYCKEVDSSGQLVSMSEYDELRMKKNGKCYELENGKVERVSVYENGVMKRVIQEFNGDVMTEYDANGKKVYEGGFSGDMKNGFVREGFGKELKSDGVVAIYAGEWKNGKREGFGTELRGLKPLYTGEWTNGMRDGKGKEMDENGKVVRSGKWMNGKYQLFVLSSLTSNQMDIEELKIGDKEYNDATVIEFRLSGLIRLKCIVIGGYCYERVRLFELDGLSELESVEIGGGSFRIGSSSRLDGNFTIINCVKLKSIQIGFESFRDYHSFVMSNLPSLESIEFGEWCFWFVRSFSLIGLPQIQSVKLGVGAFSDCQSVVFENLPKLQSIQLGGLALRGDDDDDRKTISGKPYNYKNTLTMKNLPSLTSFKGYDYNFQNVGSVILENIPQLTSSGIEFKKGYLVDECFTWTYSLQSSSNPSPLSSSFDATALESYIRSKSKYL